MVRDADQSLVTILNDAIESLSGSVGYSSLLEKIGNARFVMIGEATHGTQEFYQARIAITQQLIQKKGLYGDSDRWKLARSPSCSSLSPRKHSNGGFRKCFS